MFKVTYPNTQFERKTNISAERCSFVGVAMERERLSQQLGVVAQQERAVESQAAVAREKVKLFLEADMETAKHELRRYSFFGTCGLCAGLDAGQVVHHPPASCHDDKIDTSTTCSCKSTGTNPDV